MGSGGYSLWRGTRWLRRGLKRGMRIVSFGLFAVGAIAAAAETISIIKNSGDRKKMDSGEEKAPEELRELVADNKRLEREVDALRREEDRIQGNDQKNERLQNLSES